jgi:hypothetical protein
MKRYTFQTLVGTALMAWGGSRIGSSIDPSLWRQLDVALFALGVLSIAAAFYWKLEERVSRLEGELGSGRPKAGARPSARGTAADEA